MTYWDDYTPDTYSPVHWNTTNVPLARTLVKTFAPSYVNKAVNYASMAYGAFRKYAGRSRRQTFGRARKYGRKSYPSQRATVRSMPMRVELKQQNAGLIFSAVYPTSTGLIASASDVALGSAADTREGTVIRAKRCFWGLNITKNGVYTTVRLIAFVWKQGYALPSVSSIINNTFGSTGHYNQLEAKNFKILLDRFFNLQSTAGIVGAEDSAQNIWRGSFPLDLLMTHTTTAGSSSDQKVYFILIGDASANGLCSLNTSMQFVDV